MYLIVNKIITMKINLSIYLPIYQSIQFATYCLQLLTLPKWNTEGSPQIMPTPKLCRMLNMNYLLIQHSEDARYNHPIRSYNCAFC
jgi:hypothetical protein